ncbi:FAD-dependent oxidoreductase [Candidatus Woesearchaeota archaeon]|nr:FAD-dependent oxidoreductase [Candidatus Woesearchaeota archaeon]
MSKVYETIIIGAGIAGIAAAVYASRKRMKFLIFSEDFGGQVNVAGNIENYIGIAKTNWIEFGKQLQKQIEYNKIKINYEPVQTLKQEGKNFVVKTKNKSYETRTAIIASGARARKLNVIGEDKFANRGVTYCAICDGPLFKNKTVAVIGGGDSALEAAEFLLNIAKKIYILTVNDKMRGHEYLIENVVKHKKITIIPFAYTKEIYGDSFVKGLKYEQKEKIKDLKLDGIFVEIGRVPNTEIIKDLVSVEKDGHIIVDKHTATSVPGIFAAGDCTDIHTYQFIVAAGQGCTSLLSAAKYLQRNKES